MQFSHVFYQVGLQLKMNLTVSNAQMSLNKLNKSNGMLEKLVREGEEIEEINAKGGRRKMV
jgi:hypothetical protein